MMYVPPPTWITKVCEGIIEASDDDEDKGKEKNMKDDKAPFFRQGSSRG